jgi:putative lipoprotein
MNKRTIQKAILAAAAFVGFACTQAEQVPDAAPVPLMDTYWQLIEMNGQAIKENTMGPSAHIIFDEAEARVSGSTGCNRFFGGFTLGENNTVSLSQVGATRRACVDEGVNEFDYLAMLGKATNYSIESDKLTFSDEAKAPIAVFTAVAPE